MKLPIATLATALVTASIPSLPTSAQAFGFHHGGWGWGGVGIGLATGAVIGAALSAPYYGAYAYDYGYPAYGPGYPGYVAYGPGYAYDDDYAPVYAYDYEEGYAPSYGYTSYAYDVPSYSVTYAAPSWGYRRYADRGYGYRNYAALAHRGVRTAYASVRPGVVRAATHGGPMYRGHAR